MCYLFTLQQGHGHHSIVDDAQHALVADERMGTSVQLGYVYSSHILFF
jgi:hypothetical protein